MSSKCLISVSIVTLLATVSCGRQQQSATTPEDPFSPVPISPLPTGSLAGSQVLLLAAGSLVLGESAATSMPELSLRRPALLLAANEQLDTALRRDAREVSWMGLFEQRRAARRAPNLGIDPDRFPTVYLAPRRVETIPEPLWSQLRSLAAITGGRLVVVPAVVRIEGRPGAIGATYLLVVADVRLGQVVWRGRVVGAPQQTAELALASAAGAAVRGVAP